MNYEKLGLKGGLEIHQQLDTNKLFCNCPSYLRKDAPHFKVKRKLHKVAGETGEVDIAAEYEASLDKEFIYEGYNDTTCLVEIDEEPPHLINEQALDEAIKISLLMNCEIYPVSQIMRKTVINGSNTSGFQRTVLIAHNGFIETSFGKVRIEGVFLEEDAARPSNTSNEIDEDSLNVNKKQVIYRLDRLGIPLVEISTAPDMKTPEQIKETALKIGEILRACKVKRGIGTIRQDLNINIKGHDKVEIKGFQEQKIMIDTINFEIERQLENLKNEKRAGEVRWTLPDGKTKFARPLPGKSRMYPETDIPLLKISRDKINEIKKHLPKLKTEIKEELKKKGLSDELINLVLENNLEEFEVLMKVYNKDANLVAKMITLWRIELSKKLKISQEKIKDILSERILEQILEALKQNKFQQSDIKSIMEKIANGQKFEDAIEIEKVSHDEIAEEIAKIIKEKPGLRPNAYMGLVMQKFKGKIDAKKAMEIINKIIGE